MRGPFARYEELVASGALEPDAAQADCARRLQALDDALTRARAARPFFGRTRSPRGLYLWGGVGRGKSLLMDVFFNNTAFAPKRRVHFHEFMAETHERIARLRALPDRERRRTPGADPKAPDDPAPPLARAIAREARLLCFDEFQVRDIADAMILGRLFAGLFARGVTVVATSNRHPDDLYKDGINRQLFLPFIALIKERLDVVEIAASRDFRLAQLARAPVWYAPADADADAAMNAAWRQIASGAREHEEKLEVKGRTLVIPRAARGAARFDFVDLCGRPLGAEDYLALSRRYTTLFIDHIPVMGPLLRNEAARFVALIDALYEARVKLVCSAAAEPHDLYTEGDGAFEFQRAASRLMEMRAPDYLGAEHRLFRTGETDGTSENTDKFSLVRR